MFFPGIEPDELLKEETEDIVLDVIRQQMKDEAPAERRETWKAIAGMYSKPPENKTGQYFNAFARAARPREPGRELGERIMMDRNVNYRPIKEQEGEKKYD